LRDGPDQSEKLADFRGELMELRAEFVPGDAKTVEFKLRGATIVYDVASKEIIVNGHRAPAPLVDSKQRLTVYVDRTTLEVFASDGLTYVPMPFAPKSEDQSVTVDVKGGKATMTSLHLYKLKSIWNQK
jgi:sucrose-6-phosphate hydrolase SacC (GH32 family)